MSIEKALIERLDSLEENKENEDSPDDISNVVQLDIDNSQARLDAMIQKSNLTPEQAEEIKLGFEADLGKILGGTYLNGYKLLSANQLYVSGLGKYHEMRVIALLFSTEEKEVSNLFEKIASPTVDQLLEVKRVFPDFEFPWLQSLVDAGTNVFWILRMHELFPELPARQAIDMVKMLGEQLNDFAMLKTMFPEANIEQLTQVIDFKMVFEDIYYLQIQFPGLALDQLFSMHKIGFTPNQISETLKMFPGSSIETIVQFGTSGLKYPHIQKLQGSFPNTRLETYVDFFKVPMSELVSFLLILGKIYNFQDLEHVINIYNHFDYIGKFKSLSQVDYYEISKDPALSIFVKIFKHQWIQHATDEDKLIVARNIYFQELPTTEENVTGAYEELLLSRNEYNQANIFTGKTVIIAAHGELLANDYGGGPRFGKDAMIQAIRDQGGHVYNDKIFRPSNSYLDNVNKSRLTIESIENTPAPITFIFEGHGSKTGIYFSDGELEGAGGVHEKHDSVYISYVEFGDALIKRSNAGNMTKEDIIIISSCYNQSFIRNVFEYMRGQLYKNPHVTFPIFIGKGEYGEVTYSDLESDYGSLFNEEILGLSKKGILGVDPTSLGDIDKNYKKIGTQKHNTNPSIFIPKQNGIMQISHYNGGDDFPHQKLA